MTAVMVGQSSLNKPYFGKSLRILKYPHLLHPLRTTQRCHPAWSPTTSTTVATHNYETVLGQIDTIGAKAHTVALLAP
jgi:hypothetical protein